MSEKSTIEKFEKERAKYYDAFVQDWILNYDFVMKSIPKLIELNVPNAENLLVVGCGTGNEMIQLSTENNHWIITGIDPSPEMVTIAREKLYYVPNTRIIETDIANFDNDEKFDACTLSLVMHFMPDDGTKQQMLLDISKNLKSGATLIIVDIFGANTDFEFSCRLLEAMLPKTVEGFDISERISTLTDRVFPISEERLIELCTNAGFEPGVRFFQSAIYGGWVMRKK